ncbi:MAG: hypothetical protein AB8B63_03915 [Granulosicoccus sp.]
MSMRLAGIGFIIIDDFGNHPQPHLLAIDCSGANDIPGFMISGTYILHQRFDLLLDVLQPDALFFVHYPT